MTHKFGNHQHTGGTEGHVFELSHREWSYIRCKGLDPVLILAVLPIETEQRTICLSTSFTFFLYYYINHTFHEKWSKNYFRLQKCNQMRSNFCHKVITKLMFQALLFHLS